MTSNKYEKDFGDFNSYDHPGVITPTMFDWDEYGGDAQDGLQKMLHGIISAYGSRYVIEGCEPTINGTDAECTEGYVMYSGHVIPVLEDGTGDLSAAGSYYIINESGGYQTTGEKPTGVIVARNISGSVYDARYRVSDQTKIYLPRYVEFLGTVDHKQEAWFSGDLQITGGDVSGFENYVSGFKHIDIQTGAFGVLSCTTGIITPRQDAVHATFANGTQEGELYWSETDEALYRWHEAEQYWIQIGS